MRQFYLRRYLRLTPIFFLTLVIAAILGIPNAVRHFGGTPFTYPMSISPSMVRGKVRSAPFGRLQWKNSCTSFGHCS